ncbi:MULTISPECIES: ferritin-like fold-containing protein [unclassified Actinomyces]|uniref:ferritin-like fold-containing protein n=1 Tax=unclassified Actinomyces TaxID=2609248 RepID=UPI002017DC33|nr:MULTISPECIES: ferritin-like fold-containing protein [unclassified Actinomyces]MCL3778743.1 tRNA 2-methylthio-N6-isopentenyl adenosine(37) hydroxylase MiaE-like protein [Actinomyces sp. AC-20-1]MCL3789850.1 tRNA 2-methylthio-N6-isopentenyl adenosine(37) hydroxylase MiaE-like protein [Actinomyces sp. 187325]MCL3791522.1 tRNA 2-methylthio-N6-isopentenyl adenosine(37) hydroxylase MiaE-like protein [Actinomyces sp. 186855]MCL3793825.1 tRNA 2-methylthio-N6-isopentenyl adenosine(37) hydroxylase Mia
MSSTVPPAHVTAVAGLVAFSCTVASIRHAKDAGKAPRMAERAELLSMSAERVSAFADVDALLRSLGTDAPTAAQPYQGCLGELDERLRPADWAERLLKSHLYLGMLRDFCRALVAALPDGTREPLERALAEDAFEDFAAAQLLPGVTADAQLAGRMGLWGRRVIGDEIGSLLRVLAGFPDLLGGPVTQAALHEALSDGALRRVQGLGLNA